MTYAEKIKEQRQRWMKTRLSRMYHTYDILCAKVSKRGNIKQALPRLQHLEREIKEEEKRQRVGTWAKILTIEDREREKAGTAGLF